MANIHHKADDAVLITTSDFTRSAYALAAEHDDPYLINGVGIAQMLANVLGADHTVSGEEILRTAGLTPQELAARAAVDLTRARSQADAEFCHCHSSVVQWVGFKGRDGVPALVCPYCKRVATPEEVHEAMIHGTFGQQTVPGLEPLREAVRRREQRRRR